MGVRHVMVLGLMAITAMSPIACGDDDDETATGTEGAAGEAVAPPPDRAFRGLSTALEPEGLEVARLAGAFLNGAQAGVRISGDRQGEARSFASETEAQEYSDEVENDGDKTVIVGTVVIQAPTQDDADFIADAYEGG